MERHIIKIFILLALFSSVISAQIDTTESVADTSQTKFVMQKSPTGALLRSAIIPGWGQIYNESYWKAPVIWGFIGYYLYYWIDNNKKYNDWGNKYLQSLTSDAERSANYKSGRNFYHDQRDLFTIYIAIVYFLNLLDSYVDAHLFDFNVQEEPVGPTAKINFRLRF